MRYDSTVAFYDESKRKYNPRTSKYEGGISLIKEAWCNCTDLGIARQMEIFGALKQGRKVVRMTEEPPEKWSFLVINDGNERYKLDTLLKVSKGYAMIVGVAE